MANRLNKAPKYEDDDELSPPSPLPEALIFAAASAETASADVDVDIDVDDTWLLAEEEYRINFVLETATRFQLCVTTTLGDLKRSEDGAGGIAKALEKLRRTTGYRRIIVDFVDLLPEITDK